MNRKSLIATVKAQCSDSLKQGVLSDDESCEYVEIFRDLNGQGSYGITLNGYWCSLGGPEIREIRGPDHQRTMFRLLDSSLDEVIEAIKLGLQTIDLPNAVILTFPFDDILIAALGSSWKNLAKEWLDQGYPISDEMVLVLCQNDKQSPLWLKTQKQRLSKVLGI